MIFCDPEKEWYEIFPLDRLSCQGGLARIWELKLRKEIFWAERIRDHRVIEAVFRVQHVYAESDRGRAAKIIGGGVWNPRILKVPLTTIGHPYAEIAARGVQKRYSQRQSSSAPN